MRKNIPFAYKIVLLLICNLQLAICNLQAQNNKLDSLNNLLKTAKHDTTRFNAYMALGNYFQDNNIDTTIYYHTQAYKVASKLTGADGALRRGKTIHKMGWNYYFKDDYPKALESYQKSLSISENHLDNKNLQIEAKKLQAANLGSIGIIYKKQGDHNRALSYYYKSLTINDKLGNKVGVANILKNIGIIYSEEGEYNKALEHFFKVQKIEEKLNSKFGQSSILGNIGIVYHHQGDFSKALEFYFKALKINEEINNVISQASNLGNIGVLYSDNGEYDKALDYCFKALKINIKIGKKSSQAINYGNIGAAYSKQKKYALAEKYLKQAEQINRDLNAIYFLKDDCKNLSELYNETNKHKEALFYYKEYVLYRDSINSEENQKALIQKEMQFNFDKKAAADSVANAKEKEIKNAEIAKQQAEIKAKKNQQYALFGGLFLVLVFAGFMYNRFKVTHRQKQIIEIKEKETQHQKEIIEETHKEIKDSINYAERLQRSLMANHHILDEFFRQNYFVYFNPKEKVSGDFYWAKKLSNNQFILACADSTGHGVPGAIMSMMNMNSLKESVSAGLTEPDAILNNTRKIIIETLKNDGSLEGGKDGMDCALLKLNAEKTKLSFAAANNPVFILRPCHSEHSEESKERDASFVSMTKYDLIEFKPDKMPVGKHDKDNEPFTLHTFDLQKGDIIYTLTDGMPDQFGGENGKKYMIKNLKNLFLSIADLPMQQQKEKIDEEFTKWKGSLEQVDDVCIIGVRV